MQRHPDYTRERTRQLVDRLGKKIYADRKWVDDLQVAGPVERISYAEAQNLSDFRPAKPGDQYRPAWATFWFRVTATVPAEWKGSRVDFYWDTQSEATLWVDAKSVQGLNVTHGDRPDAVLIEHAKGGEQVDFQVEMACNQKFGVSTGGGNSTGQSVISPHHLRHAELVRFNAKAFELYYDALVLSKLEADWPGKTVPPTCPGPASC